MNSQPTIAGRIVCGLAFAPIVCSIFVLREFSKGAASFTKDTSHDSPAGTAIFLSLTLGPALVALILPRRSIVTLAGLFIVPYIIMAIPYLMIPPIGIALLLPPLVWYLTVLRPVLAQPLYP